MWQGKSGAETAQAPSPELHARSSATGPGNLQALQSGGLYQSLLLCGDLPDAWPWLIHAVIGLRPTAPVQGGVWCVLEAQIGVGQSTPLEPPKDGDMVSEMPRVPAHMEVMHGSHSVQMQALGAPLGAAVSCISASCWLSYVGTLFHVLMPVSAWLIAGMAGSG